MKPPLTASPDKEPQRLITLGDHIDAIINKDFAQPRTPTPQVSVVVIFLLYHYSFLALIL